MNDHLLALASEEADGGRLIVWRSGASNLGYLLQLPGSDAVVAVDVPNGTELTERLHRYGVRLSAVLITHTDWDHVNGLSQVLKDTGAVLFCGERIPGHPGHRVEDGSSWNQDGAEILALDTSGHSACDISYVLPGLDLCFCGDTLFQHGCGRMFAGPPDTFWRSLKRLRDLPSATRMCCGHDYREDNAAFIAAQFPDLPWAQEAVQTLRGEVEEQGFPVPFLLGLQKRQNPFLLSDDPEVARSLGLEGAAPESVFAELRRRRNAL